LAKGEGEKRGSIPVGTSKDGSGPSDGALIGGTLKPDIGKSKEPLRDVNRCKELIGALREECLLDLGRHRRRRGRQCADARAGELALRGSASSAEVIEQPDSSTAAPEPQSLPVHCAVFQIAMALIVQKYGGTSVGSVARIRNVAKRIAKWKAAGHDLVVVPSRWRARRTACLRSRRRSSRTRTLASWTS
jgi:hypothetical protein